MPYVQASPRARAGYAAPLFSVVAFVVAAGLSLEGSPFCTAPRAEMVHAQFAYDPALAGTYKTWGVDVELRADGSARIESGTEPRDATWRSDARMIAVDWGEGSFGAAQEWWARKPAPLGHRSGQGEGQGEGQAEAATCEGGSC